MTDRANRINCKHLRTRNLKFLQQNLTRTPIVYVTLRSNMLHPSMKFTLFALLVSSIPVSASAFSAVAPIRGDSVGGSIDRSMKDVDENISYDPTQGENAALTRNNKNEVWVPQVAI